MKREDLRAGIEWKEEEEPQTDEEMFQVVKLLALNQPRAEPST